MAVKKPGKYASIVPTLPPLPPTDLSHQEKVEAVKWEVAHGQAPAVRTEYDRLLALLRMGFTTVPGPGAPALVTRYTELRALRDIVNALAALVALYLDAYEQLMAESKDAQAEGWGQYGVGDDTLRLPDGSKVKVQKEPCGKVVDKEAFRQWCLTNGYERQLQLWPSTMNTIVKERLVHGEQPPDGTEAYAYTKIVYTPAQKEG